VRELQPLAERAEGHRVLADHVAERSDITAISCRVRSPASPGDRTRPPGQVAAERLGDHLGHAQRGAAGRVLLEAMVDLGDLHV